MGIYLFYLAAFVSALLWGLAAAFGPALFSEAHGDRPESERPGTLFWTALAAFAAGLGGSGAMLTREGHFSSARSLVFAIVTGLLASGLVGTGTSWLLRRD